MMCFVAPKRKCGHVRGTYLCIYWQLVSCRRLGFVCKDKQGQNIEGLCSVLKNIEKRKFYSSL